MTMTAPVKPKVLIVDDSPESLHLLVEALRDCCAVVAARDGHHAMEMACRLPLPEVILLDVMMPGIDGYQVCRQLKAKEEFRHIPILFITSLQGAEAEQQALSMGGVDFIRKPINPAVVKARTMTHVELARARLQLVQQNRQLQEAAGMRDLVERMMHHDLKSPLGGIIGLPEILMEDDNLTHDQKEMLEQIIKGGHAMLEMINRSLDLYKMEEGTYLFQPDAVDLRLLFERIVVENHSLALRKSCPVVIHAEAEPSLWLVPAEELLCRSLFGNLVKNALEASPSGVPVTVTLTREPGEIEVRIHNQGAVPLPIREQFFSKFATHGKKGGTGLGCYSAMRMARIQQAHLSMKTSEEAGTSLLVRFPEWTAPVKEAP